MLVTRGLELDLSILVMIVHDKLSIPFVTS